MSRPNWYDYTQLQKTLLLPLFISYPPFSSSPPSSFLPSQLSLGIWLMILRFMGDMPEPNLTQTPQEKENTSFAKKLYGSLSKKLSGSKLAEELGEVRQGVKGKG